MKPKTETATKEVKKTNWWKWLFWILVILLVLSWSSRNEEIGYCVDECVSDTNFCMTLYSEPVSDRNGNEYYLDSDVEQCINDLESCVDDCNS